MTPFHWKGWVRKMVHVENLVQQWQGRVRVFIQDPRVLKMLGLAGAFGAGLLGAAASLRNHPLPLTMGLICALTGYGSALAVLGSCLGYPLFWGSAGRVGIFWALGAGILARIPKTARTEGLQLLAAGVLAAAPILYLQASSGGILLLQVGCGVFGVLLFRMARDDRVARYPVLAMAALALAQVWPLPWVGLGHLLLGLAAAAGTFPAAVLVGLGLDLAQTQTVPMAAVGALGWMARLIPGARPLAWLGSGIGYLAVAAVLGEGGLSPLPGLLLGGLAGRLLPVELRTRPRRGGTGPAQVRLEQAAAVMHSIRNQLAAVRSPPIDREALLDQVRVRACGGCSCRGHCQERENLTAEALTDPAAFTCRKPNRIRPALNLSRERLARIQGERSRLGEYRQVLCRQYDVLGGYLRSLSDGLPRSSGAAKPRYRVQAAVRSRSRHPVSGDRVFCFPGAGGNYYVLLCDGMGTGGAAAREGAWAGGLLRQLIRCGFSPERALRVFGGLLTLRGKAGAVTVDLCELRLDRGTGRLFKWGAAPSWLLKERGTEKIGTAGPPPGSSLREDSLEVLRLSLRRGEVLMLVSDGLDGEVMPGRIHIATDAPPGELAERLLQESRRGDDDETVVAIRLRPADSGTIIA